MAPGQKRAGRQFKLSKDIDSKGQWAPKKEVAAKKSLWSAYLQSKVWPVDDEDGSGCTWSGEYKPKYSEDKPHKHEKGSLEKSEWKNANDVLKIYTNPIEPRDVIKEKENPALGCLEANWKSKMGALWGRN